MCNERARHELRCRKYIVIFSRSFSRNEKPCASQGVCYKFRRGSYHDCNSGNYNFNRLQQHNFRLRRKAGLEAIWDPPPVTSSINVGVRPPRWSHAGANLPLCLNVLLDTCVKYLEFTFEPAHTSATHVKRVHGHLNLEPWTSLRRIRA